MQISFVSNGFLFLGGLCASAREPLFDGLDWPGSSGSPLTIRVIPSFVQARVKLGMDLVSGIKNLCCDLVEFHNPDFLAQSRGVRRERQTKIREMIKRDFKI
jgi:hypothetical protein